MSQVVSTEITRKIAKLSRLALTDLELEQYTKELEKILQFMEELKEVKTDGVEPIIHGIPLESRFREDEAILLNEAETKKIVACSEQSLYDQYKVPQVLGAES